jgi:uncharacterized coiled-coil DUF342 family protein
MIDQSLITSVVDYIVPALCGAVGWLANAKFRKIKTENAQLSTLKGVIDAQDQSLIAISARVTVLEEHLQQCHEERVRLMKAVADLRGKE